MCCRALLVHGHPSPVPDAPRVWQGDQFPVGRNFPVSEACLLQLAAQDRNAVEDELVEQFGTVDNDFQNTLTSIHVKLV